MPVKEKYSRNERLFDELMKLPRPTAVVLVRKYGISASRIYQIVTREKIRRGLIAPPKPKMKKKKKKKTAVVAA